MITYIIKRGSLRSVALDQNGRSGCRKVTYIHTYMYIYTLLASESGCCVHRAFCRCFRMSVRHLLTTSAYHWRALSVSLSVNFASPTLSERSEARRSKPVRQEMDSVAAWQFGLTPALKGAPTPIPDTLHRLTPDHKSHPTVPPPPTPSCPFSIHETNKQQKIYIAASSGRRVMTLNPFCVGSCM